MRQKGLEIKIHAAAFYFAHISRDLDDIKNAFGVSESAIRKWEKTPEWHEALDIFGYTGDRNFAAKATRDTARDAGEVFEKAKAVYIAAMLRGEPKHKLATIAGDAVGLPRRRIHDWAKQYDWRAEAQR